MSQSYVIEVGEDQVGLVLRESGEPDFRFHAAHTAYHPLEGRRFANAALAEKAARAHRAQVLSRRHNKTGYQNLEL
ncbi:MAG: hypothetical protein MUC37_09310 [Hyphomicrobium sp.]|jgi:hypothetical protein|nr:hypothetical protein [Hyphomicrobium sp.]